MNLEILIRTKDRVGYLLKENEKARNSDSWLICKYWATFYPTKMHRDEKGKAMVYLDDVAMFQSSESIRRVRQKIQNEERMWLPTDPEVRKQRGISEEVYKEFSINN